MNRNPLVCLYEYAYLSIFSVNRYTVDLWPIILWNSVKCHLHKFFKYFYLWLFGKSDTNWILLSFVTPFKTTQWVQALPCHYLLAFFNSISYLNRLNKSPLRSKSTISNVILNVSNSSCFLFLFLVMVYFSSWLWLLLFLQTGRIWRVQKYATSRQNR